MINYQDVASAVLPLDALEENLSLVFLALDSSRCSLAKVHVWLILSWPSPSVFTLSV